MFLIIDQFIISIRLDPHAILIADVNGSHKYDLLNFKEQYPRFPGKLILQDLQEIINLLSGELGGIEPMIYSFYNPQSIKGA